MSIKLSGFDLEREQEALIYLDIPEKEFMLRNQKLCETNRLKHAKHCVFYVSGIFWKRSYDFYEHLTLEDEKVFKVPWIIKEFVDFQTHISQNYSCVTFYLDKVVFYLGN